MRGPRRGNMIVLFSFGFLGVLQAQVNNAYIPLVPQVKEYRVYQTNTTNLNIAPFVKRAYFCKLEDVYQESRFPVLFRLGTKKYVDQLEHK